MTPTYGWAFRRLLPGAKWICRDADEYENYEWLDERPQPKKAECDAVIPDILAERDRVLARANRHQAFIAEADPLFFAWQRGEATEEEWLAKCAEIRARFPYVDVEQ
jgi:hypothetical protein